MKKVVLALAIFAAVAPVFGGTDPTRDLLFADRARNFIRFIFDPQADRALQYEVDSFEPKDLHPIPAGLTLRANRNVDIYLGDYNPLTQSYTIDMKRTADPNYGAIAEFLNDVKATTEALGVAPAPKGGADLRKSLSGCKLFQELLDDAKRALTAQEMSPDRFKKLVANAHGFSGADDAGSAFEDAIKQIENNNTTATSDLNEIVEKFGVLGSAKPTETCTDNIAGLLVSYNDLRSQANDILPKKRALADALKSLVDFLEPYRKTSAWSGKSKAEAELTDYVFPKTAEVDFEKQNEVTVAAAAKQVTLKENRITITTSANPTTAAFTVRQDSFVVPERAAAMVFNRITYPKYGTTKDKDGKTVVDRVKDDDPVNAAIMLNLIPRLPISVAYPFFQIGISSAKDFPGFLAGLGVRFTGPVAWSISAGAMITRYKDLDQSLHVGDEVTGTSDIDKHLQWRFSPIKAYGAVQLKF